MTAEAASPNCIEITVPFLEAVNHQDLPPVQIMGGIGSAALVDSQTRILPAERYIITGPNFLEDPIVQAALQPIRAEDGTLRDLDALVLSADEAKVAQVEEIAERTIDGQLDVSVFHLHSADQLTEQRAQPLGWQAFKTFVSDRYVHQDGSRDGDMEKALFPFAVPLPSAVLETWQLEIGDRTFPVANPAATVLNYLTRSISGLRPKDAEKVDMMAERVFSKAPELVDWAIHGPGQSQMDLAAILHTLRWSSSISPENRTLDVGGAIAIKAGSVRKLLEHEAFMLPDVDSNTRDAVMAWTLTKSRVLGIGESQQGLVKVFRKYFEGMVDGITKNSATASAP